MLIASVDGEKPAGLFPSVLSGCGALADQETARRRRHVERVEPSEDTGLLQSPREDDRERHLVELNARPVRAAVDPEVLIEATVRALRNREVHQRAQRCDGVAGGEQRCRRLNEVAGPHQVVPSHVLVAFAAPPRDAHRRDDRARIALVFVREQQVDAPLVKSRAVPGGLSQGEAFGRSPPLDAEMPQRRLERRHKRLEQVRDRTVPRVAERQADGERAGPGDVDLGGDSDIAVVRGVELPIHFQVVVQVGPAVVDGHVAAGASHDRRGGAKRHPRAALERDDDRAGFGVENLRVVVPAADLQMRRAQEVRVQTASYLGSRFERRPHQHAVVMRCADECLVDRIYAVLCGVDDLEPERHFVEAGDARARVPPFVVEEGRAVGDEELKVADLWRVDGRIEDFREDAGRHRVPDVAGAGVRGADRLLRAASPPRRQPRPVRSGRPDHRVTTVTPHGRSPTRMRFSTVRDGTSTTDTSFDGPFAV